jgi:hypothetical protein
MRVHHGRMTTMKSKMPTNLDIFIPKISSQHSKGGYSRNIYGIDECL